VTRLWADTHTHTHTQTGSWPSWFGYIARWYTRLKTATHPSTTCNWAQRIGHATNDATAVPNSQPPRPPNHWKGPKRLRLGISFRRHRDDTSYMVRLDSDVVIILGWNVGLCPRSAHRAKWANSSLYRAAGAEQDAHHYHHRGIYISCLSLCVNISVSNVQNNM